MDDIRERMCNNYCGFGVKFGAGKDIACKHCPLNELPKWIPVAERLPEMGSTVLMQNTGGWMFVATYAVTPKRKYWAVLGHDYALDEAIAWMPLPERLEDIHGRESREAINYPETMRRWIKDAKERYAK